MGVNSKLLLYLNAQKKHSIEFKFSIRRENGQIGAFLLYCLQRTSSWIALVRFVPLIKEERDFNLFAFGFPPRILC